MGRWMGFLAPGCIWACGGKFWHLDTLLGMQVDILAPIEPFWYPGGVCLDMRVGILVQWVGILVLSTRWYTCVPEYVCTLGHYPIENSITLYCSLLDTTVYLLETNVFMRQLIVQILFVFFSICITNVN